MSSAEKILMEALTLPAGERARVARDLLRSLDDSEDEPEDAAEAWSDELSRRLDDVDQGRVTTLSLDEVKRRMAERRRARRR